jgi:integrase
MDTQSTRIADSVRLMLNLGIRHGEIINLRKADVDFDNDTVLIRQPNNLSGGQRLKLDPESRSAITTQREK